MTFLIVSTNWHFKIQLLKNYIHYNFTYFFGKYNFPLHTACMFFQRYQCRNQASCVGDTTVPLGFRCICPAGYQGTYCESRKLDTHLYCYGPACCWRSSFSVFILWFIEAQMNPVEILSLLSCSENFVIIPFCSEPPAQP